MKTKILAFVMGLALLAACKKDNNNNPQPANQQQVKQPQGETIKFVLTASYYHDSINYLIVNGAFSSGSVGGFTKNKVNIWTCQTDSAHCIFSYDFYPYPTVTDTLQLDIYVNSVLKYTFKNSDSQPGIMSPTDGLSL